MNYKVVIFGLGVFGITVKKLKVQEYSAGDYNVTWLKIHSIKYIMQLHFWDKDKVVGFG